MSVRSIRTKEDLTIFISLATAIGILVSAVIIMWAIT